MKRLVNDFFARMRKISWATVGVAVACVFWAAGCGMFDSDSEGKNKEPSTSGIYVDAILGKWELIALGQIEKDMKKIEPEGFYIEFLSDGIWQSYNPLKDEFYYSNYRIDNKFLYYDYEKKYDEGRSDYAYVFYENQLILYFHQGVRTKLGVQPNIFIYQPKK